MRLLEEIAAVALEFGRLLLESGASARCVDEVTAQVAVALGAERVDVRVNYASLDVSIKIASDEISRMRKVGPLGVNQRLYHALCCAAERVATQGLTVAEARSELAQFVRDTPRHPDWVVGIAVGVACAAFGRLMGVDRVAVGPIFVAAMSAQIARRRLALWKVNVFISGALVAFLGSASCVIGARCFGSHTVSTDMIATVLLLVPGVPAFNAQYDILEGYPSLGSARGVWVLVMLVFMTAGVWLAQGLLGEGR